MLKGIREHVEEIAALSDNMVRAHADNLVKDIETIERDYVLIKISDVKEDAKEFFNPEGGDREQDKLLRKNLARRVIYEVYKAIKEHGDKNDH